MPSAVSSRGQRRGPGGRTGRAGFCGRVGVVRRCRALPAQSGGSPPHAAHRPPGTAAAVPSPTRSGATAGGWSSAMAAPTSDRACWLTTYPVRLIAWLTARSAAGDTECPPFSTRDTVPRDTPAAAATSSVVGRFRPTIPAPCYVARQPGLTDPPPLLPRLSRHSANVKLGGRARTWLSSDLRRSRGHQVSSSSRKRAGASGA